MGRKPVKSRMRLVAVRAEGARRLRRCPEGAVRVWDVERRVADGETMVLCGDGLWRKGRLFLPEGCMAVRDKNGVFDDCGTMRREAWRGGVLVSFVTAEELCGRFAARGVFGDELEWGFYGEAGGP